MSILYKVARETGNAFVHASIYGFVGYFGARIVKQVDPVGALICGAVAGATTALCFRRSKDTVRKIAGLIALIGAPFILCERLRLPMPIQTCLIVTGATALLAIFIQQFREENESEEESEKIKAEIDKSKKELEADFKKSQADFDKTKQKMDDDFQKRKQKMDADFNKDTSTGNDDVSEAHAMFMHQQHVDQAMQFQQQLMDQAAFNHMDTAQHHIDHFMSQPTF